MSQIRRAIYWQFAALLTVTVLIAVISRYFPIVDFIEALQTRVMEWGAWGAVCYPLLFAVCNILLLPGGVLAVGGGFFFGLWWGLLIVFAGNLVGAAISFASSRWVARQWFQRKPSKNPTLRALEPALERENWKIILLSQLHPLFPTSLLNYLYGLTRIRFGTYMLWASIGRAPGLFLYVYVGTLGQLGLKLMRGRSQPRVIEYWTWGSLCYNCVADAHFGPHRTSGNTNLSRIGDSGWPNRPSASSCEGRHFANVSSCMLD